MQPVEGEVEGLRAPLALVLSLLAEGSGMLEALALAVLALALKKVEAWSRGEPGSEFKFVY